MQNLLQKHWFWKYAFGANRLIVNNTELVNEKIIFSVKVFYILMLAVLSEFLYSTNYYLNIVFTDLLWPVYWAQIAIEGLGRLSET